MGVLIAMAVYSTAENQKDIYLDKCLESLKNTVDLKEHKLVLSINGYTDATTEILYFYRDIISKVITNDKNIGTAEAINKVWKLREPGQHCIKMDDDVVINEAGWVEKLLDVLKYDITIGQAGLKRKDLIENPAHHDDYFRSELEMLLHYPGHPWIIVEKVHHCMGTCVLHSSALLDKVGYLYQPTLYGYDDVLMSKRSLVAGFKNVFLPHINIDHIDPGGGNYTAWKSREAGEQASMINKLMTDYETGAKSFYYNPFQ